MSEIRGPVHLIGIGGIHMSAIAQLLLQRGVAVSGSDIRPSELTERVRSMGANVTIGHDAANVGAAALVVTTAAASEDNPEIAEARRKGIPLILRAEMVARLMEGKRVVAIAGTAGKTTTSSLVAFILSEAGRRPMYLLGGDSIDLGGNAAWGEGDLCVVEADEYKRAFLEYAPQVAVVTNVEPDHLDYYLTAAAYHEAFGAFAARVVAGGLLLVCGDDPGAIHAARGAGASVTVETFGTGAHETWTAVPTGIDAGFAIRHEGSAVGEVQPRVPGRAYLLDTLAAAAVCLRLGVDFDTVRSAISRFRGAHRRFELVGEAGGVTVMDDYAHHPAKVRAMIDAARTRFAGRRLIGVYQPHTYSRIAYLWDDWTRCWDGLDALVVLETYAAREKPLSGRSARDLANAITRPAASYAADFPTAARQAVSLVRPGDVIFTIGAGDVTELGPKILELLR